jgi:hypothetical protein
LAPVGIAIGVLWLAISSVMLFAYARANGTVVQLIEKGSGDNAVYCPIFVFQDKSGVLHTNQSSSGSNPPRFPVSAKVAILYPSQNPSDGMIEDFVLLWVVPSVLIVLSIFYGVIGLIVHRLLQKKQTI